MERVHVVRGGKVYPLNSGETEVLFMECVGRGIVRYIVVCFKKSTSDWFMTCGEGQVSPL